MPSIQSIHSATHEGTDGFIIEWEFIGFSEFGAKFRAVAMTASRFPSTIVTAEVVGVREFDPRDYNVQVFVPTEGFMSAGINNPAEWLHDEYRDRFRG